MADHDARFAAKRCVLLATGGAMPDVSGEMRDRRCTESARYDIVAYRGRPIP
jgi:hypothetical protein